MRIRKNDLLPWFIQDHGTLPASYLKSCRKFFDSIKLQAVDNLKKEFDICRIVLYKGSMAFIANAAQDGRQLKLDEARRLVHKTCVARRTART